MTLKSILLTLLGVILAGLPAVVFAQEPASPANPFETVEEESNGNIIINIPDELEDILLSEPAKTTKKQESGKHKATSGKMNGFRIQVFSDGRNQSTLAARARARGSAIVAKFPKYRGQVYTFSKSPNWYTRVGNFATQAQANAALAELKRAFPAFASEMRVVKSTVVIRK